MKIRCDRTVPATSFVTGHVEVSKTGMKMAKGKCPVCGTTVNRILGKLDLRNRVQLVVLAYESGLIRPGRGR